MDEEELVKQFMDDVQIIRKEITEIKANSELILKTEMERNQASEHSESRHRLLRTPREVSKVMLTEGVQTVERQPTFTEIEEKYRKLAEEVSVLTKATPVTYVNCSHLGASSAADSRESERYILNPPPKNLTLSSNPTQPKISTPLPVAKPPQFP
jgi:hypothetical protein